MRKITSNASNAFWNSESFKESNTRVDVGEYNAIPTLVLYRTVLAVLDGRVLRLYNGGYTTNTTKERLNGILKRIGHRVFQKSFEWFIEDDRGNIQPFVDGIEIKIN